MIQILEKYIEQSSCKGIETLHEENRQMGREIEQIEKKVGRVRLDEDDEDIDKKEQKLKEYLLMDRDDIEDELVALQDQENEIQHLIQYLSKYVSHSKSNSVQIQAFHNNVEQLIKIIQNSRLKSINQRCIQLMQGWVSAMNEQLQNKLNNLVISNNQYIIINTEEIHKNINLIQQQNSKQYVYTIFHKLITYDVPSSSYILRIPNSITSTQKIVKIQKQYIRFPKEETINHFQHLFQAISQSTLLVDRLLQIIPDSNKIINLSCIQCLNELRGDIDYILPYLNLQDRKAIINIVNKSAIDDLSIYDLLVRLKLKGQDGDMLSKIISGLVQKIKQNYENLQSVVVFLQMAQNDHKTLNMGFFVSNSLVEELQDIMQYEAVKRLLTLREQFRFKIHHHDFM